MPTYEYRCLKCGRSFDAFQSIKEDSLTKCPKCKGKVKRQIGTGAGIIFKGSGFYQTDYKKSVAPTSEQKPSDKPEKTEKSDKKGTDTKKSDKPKTKDS